MLRIAYSPKMSPAMIRSASLTVVALACMLCAGAARAQVSTADLVTRIDRLEAAIRDLTGNVEQLQYRNQQLEQQLQRLEGTQGRLDDGKGGQRPPNAPPARPAAQYPPPSAAASPPAGAPLPPAPIAQAEPAPGRRGDAFDPNANPNAPGSPRQLGTSTAANEPPPPISDRARARSASARRAARPLDTLRPAGRRRARRPIAAAAARQSERNRRHAGDAAAEQFAEGRLRPRLRLCPAQGLCARGRHLPHLPAPISERPPGAGSAILARREPVSAAAISRRRRSLPRRFDEV